MNRKFGIELEVTGSTKQQVLLALQGEGIVAQSVGYEHRNRPFWKLVPDRSVTGAEISNHDLETGFEIVSPILSGQEGLEQVRKVCRALTNLGVGVDHTCGFHVHVDATGMDISELCFLAYRYCKQETQLDECMPMSRRYNRYCGETASSFKKTLAELTRRLSPEFDDVKEELSELFASGRLSLRDFKESVGNYWNRYTKLNLAALVRHGTIEFRQHEGTVLAEKVLPWIEFCLTFVETSKVPFATETVQAAVPENPWQGMTTNIIRLLPPARANASWKSEIFLIEALLAARTFTSPEDLAFYITTASRGLVVASSIHTIVNRLRRRGVDIRTRRNVGYTLATPPVQAVSKCLEAVFELTEIEPVTITVRSIAICAERAPSVTPANVFPRLLRKKVFPTTVPDLFAGLRPEIKTYLLERQEMFKS